MASFTNNGRDTFGPETLFSPDYNIINSALAQRQARFDQGYAALRGLRDNLVNGELTNAENRKFRNDQMAKISKDIQALSSSDLSKAENVKKGMGLFDSIVNDKELMHDFAMTRFMRQEIGRAEQYRTSVDPEMRKRYNSESVELMNLKMLDLSNAKRGTGEIGGVLPTRYVAKEDVNKYLSDLAKQEGLEIKGTEQSGMYLVSTTNGKQAEIPFTEWAMQRIQGGFDPQFRVSAELRQEKTVRGIMQAEGVSREEAMGMLGSELKGDLVAAGEKRIRDLKATGERVRQKLHQYEKYGNTIPDEEVARYEALQNELKMIDSFASNERSNLNNLQEQGAEYFAQNFSHHLKNQIQTNTAAGWAKTYAQSTSEVDVKPDQVALTVYREENANTRMLAKFTHDERMKIFDHDLSSQRMERQFQLDVKLDNNRTQNDAWLLAQKADLEASLATSGTGTRGKKRAEPLITDIGAFTNASQDLTAYELASTSQGQVINDISTHVSGSGGLIENVFEGIPEKQGLYLQAVESIQNAIDNGGDPSVIDAEGISAIREVLTENGILLDYTGRENGTLERNNKAYWSDMMMNLSYKLRDRFENMPVDETSNTYQDGASKVDVISRLDGLMGNYEQNNTKMQNGVKALFAEGGLLEGESIGEYFTILQKPDGTLLHYPKDDLPASVKTALSSLMPQEYQDQARQSGRSVLMNQIPGNVVEALRTGNEVLRVQRIAADGERKDIEIDELGEEGFAQGNLAVIQERYGDNMIIDIDPSTNQVTFEFKPTGAKENGEDGPKEGYAFTVPFSKAKELNPAIASQVQRFENEAVSLSPLGRKILTQLKPGTRNTNITPSIYSSRGIEFNVRQTKKSVLNESGQYVSVPVLKIDSRYRNPLTQRWTSETAEIDVPGNDRIQTAAEVERMMHVLGKQKLQEFAAMVAEDRRRRNLAEKQQTQNS